VELVCAEESALVAPVRENAAPGDSEEDPFCSFWKGEDARVHAELCQVLDDAGIPQKTVFRRDHLFNLNQYQAFEIGVPFSMFEKAEAVVEAAYGNAAGTAGGEEEGEDEEFTAEGAEEAEGPQSSRRSKEIAEKVTGERGADDDGRD
jgi:hypothetical protein